MNKPTTYGVHYLGSKLKLIPHIIGLTKQILPSGGTVIDVFTGSGRVAQGLKQSNYSVITGDLNEASRVYSNTFVHTQDHSHLQPHIDHMNSLTGYKGWITENYAGEGDPTAEHELHRFMHPKNTVKADAARDYVESLDLSQYDKDILICSIIFAMQNCDNTVGQQHAYLKHWGSRAHNNINFTLPVSLTGPIGKGHIHGDCFQVEYPQADLAYLDPPYTPSVPYHEYYHIWDSITLWDKPKTALKARRRIDRVKRNKTEDYNEIFTKIPWYDIKNQDSIELNGVYQSFEKMIGDKLSHIPNIMISYSNESILSKEQMFDLLGKYGDVTLKEIDHKRNVMGSIGTLEYKQDGIKSFNPNVTEYIFLLKR
jgi:adenine-specific DNA-methyltransferase